MMNCKAVLGQLNSQSLLHHVNRWNDPDCVTYSDSTSSIKKGNFCSHPSWPILCFYFSTGKILTLAFSCLSYVNYIYIFLNSIPEACDSWFWTWYIIKTWFEVIFDSQTWIDGYCLGRSFSSLFVVFFALNFILWTPWHVKSKCALN